MQKGNGDNATGKAAGAVSGAEEEAGLDLSAVFVRQQRAANNLVVSLAEMIDGIDRLAARTWMDQ